MLYVLLAIILVLLIVIVFLYDREATELHKLRAAFEDEEKIIQKYLDAHGIEVKPKEGDSSEN